MDFFEALKKVQKQKYPDFEAGVFDNDINRCLDFAGFRKYIALDTFLQVCLTKLEGIYVRELAHLSKNGKMYWTHDHMQ